MSLNTGDLFSWLKDSFSPSMETRDMSKDSSLFSNAAHVPGYMDYDPKLAAFMARNSIKKKGRNSKWFEL